MTNRQNMPVYLNWRKAECYLDFLFTLRDNSHDKFDPMVYEQLVNLKERLDHGERTYELYEEIMRST